MLSRTANILGALGIALADAQTAQLADSSGLAPTDAAALNAIGLVPGCSIATVRVALGITHPGSVRTIDRLVSAGLAERRSGVDGRTVGLHLTTEGEQVWLRQSAARLQWLEGIVAGMTPPQRDDVERVASLILAAVTGDDESAERICRLCDERCCPQDRCPVTLAIERDA